MPKIRFFKCAKNVPNLILYINSEKRLKNGTFRNVSKMCQKCATKCAKNVPNVSLYIIV